MNVGVASLKMCYPPGTECGSSLTARSVTSLTFDQGEDKLIIIQIASPCLTFSASPRLCEDTAGE
ncbi:MAG: hypothetical protein NHB32_00135 [Fischerella sp. CENA71]|nr:hypothetical protein [Fischerella sp. CENA71]